MIEGIYSALDSVFGSMLMQHPMGVVTISGIILGAFFTLLNYFLVDQSKMKKLQEMNKEFQKELKEAQAKKDEKKMRKLQQKQMEMLKLQNEVMKDSMLKPMLFTLPIFWIFFGWMRRWLTEVAIIKVPFKFFLFDWIHGMYHSALPADELGFFGWYFLTSMIVSSVLRKLLDMA
ncbi:hypothetical protein DRN43_00210 [Thermococci archaeon]|uniref:EMC3/TMCO1 family protein n=1 Tax=Palaeococcus sp. (in: euryarchaeotes) TaxID=2820298 RepID=UPI000F125E71|nr:EMC3/TMCO1 family protein [Palaeococcus sp. (in: euryarchaeotes)]MCD6559735.1 DUF106 domain-containing protein [Palaeococcus sp. (in: euryarchaeotes)]RLF75678.1 MAG: hypothetical protein DRN39_06915 [Thermococci archaeon]RLF91180.1 MAG: hypothetical protein DRN43_00210 [Thermococci archaeon]